MIDLASLQKLKAELKHRMVEDEKVLDEMRLDVRALKSQTRKIQPRSANYISIVGTDGGSNQLKFDPFAIQLVRVVDSSKKEYCLEVVTPRTSLTELTFKHLQGGVPRSALGELMVYLGVSHIADLSPVFKDDPKEISPSWMNVYREITEWAVLFHLVRNSNFANDVLIVCDGLLQSKMFAGNLFGRLREGLEDAIRMQFELHKRRIYICGVAKHNSVLQAYRIALALEGILRNAYPCFVEVPYEMEKRVYEWDEWISRTDKFVAGKMFLVKFGPGRFDPVWAIDVLVAQTNEAQTVFGYLLEDARNGFPIPLFPNCLQKAHENAALVDFDMEILEDQIIDVLRENLGDKKWVIDELSLQETDITARRYR